MLASLRTAVDFLVVIILLLACFTAGRALAADGSSNRVTNIPLVITNVTSEKVCGRPLSGNSKEIICFPEAAPLEETLAMPTEIVATRNATCAKDDDQWKCWGVTSAITFEQLKMVKTSASKNDTLFGYGASICRIDATRGIVSCSQNYQMANDPLRMQSSLAPSRIGDHFGPFKKLQLVAGNQEYLCFVDDDVLKCAAAYTAQKIAERQLKNAKALALSSAAICVVDDSGNRCFNSVGELKPMSRPSWKGAKKLVANLTDVCAILSTDDVECLTTNASTSLIGEKKPEDLGSVLDLGLGRGFACALKRDRTISCWSNGSATNFEPPRKLENVLQMSVAETHACAIDQSGATTCWGPSNDQGQLLPPLRAGTPVQAVDLNGLRCAWNSTGARCTATYGGNDIVTKMPYLENVVSIAISPGYQKTACAITKTQTGTATTCWGSQPELLKVPTSVVNPKSISFTDESACAILGDGTLRCWGKQTGMPWNVVPRDVSQVDLRPDRLCVNDYFGFTCWGVKLHESKVATPAKWRNSIEVEEFALGREHSCVRTATYVECWGGNDSGQLNVPPMIDPFSMMAADDVTCASDRDGVLCWGPAYGISAPRQPTTLRRFENNRP